MPRPKPSDTHIKAFDDDGYVVAKQLFTPEEATAYKRHYLDLRTENHHEFTYTGDKAQNEFPRMLHMHRWDQTSLDWLLSDRLKSWLVRLSGGIDPYAVQTMVYFKPPGVRGQALHQDQLFLRVHPGRVIAAWMALEKVDELNGCLRVAPGSHQLPLLCEARADLENSFVDVGSDVPPDLETVPVEMEAGDVLFFQGLLIHGSLPNRSADRSRTSLIGHYITGDAQRVADFYHPVLRMDGTVVDLDVSPTGGPCGRWVTKEGSSVLEITEAPSP